MSSSRLGCLYWTGSFECDQAEVAIEDDRDFPSQIRRIMVLPISIVIATYNRELDLLKTLLSLQKLESIAEVIVVDNASTDNTSELIQQEFCEVKLIRLSENQGVPAFSIGVQAASQPFVFLLDDDAVPEKGTLQQVVNSFTEDSKIAVIACHIVDSGGKSVTSGWPDYPLCFWGCGAALRKSALIDQPYLYDPVLFLHGTEMDLAIRLYADGYVVRYLPKALVHHQFSTKNRSEERRVYFLVQSALRFSLKHLPLRFAILATWRHLGWLLYRAWNTQCSLAYASGMLEALKQFPSTIKERHPVPVSIARVYFEQVWEYEPLTFRLLRALTGKPLPRKHKQRGFPVWSDFLSNRK